ncbi:hypothetical protein J3R80_07065 [Aliiroseovarius sp. Z3]|uniref:hypothetical protein n=1 Tax=Aliiroseovarius sp. Z3 TaxID=2811402 RepID=UPI0023B25C9D|nr:hypothetical protein [Aliiroseovarius sp. Z3]MDE9450229.1 hypothetical protein [Aliiroseovarius sp. Z3]
MTQHLTHGGLPEGMTRWQFFGLIEQARRQMGLSKGAVAGAVAIQGSVPFHFGLIPQMTMT